MTQPPVRFERGMPLSAALLNEVQRAILRALQEHDHSGGARAAPLGMDGLAAGAVTGPKLADGAVAARALADGAVEGRALADGAVTDRALARGAVGTAALADGAVGEAQLSAAVLRLIRARSDQVSSASQVVWRDPLVVLRPERDLALDIGILGTLVEPERVYWTPPVIALDPEGRPVQLRPGAGGARLEVIEFAADNREVAALYRALDGQVMRAAEEIGALGAVRVTAAQPAAAPAGTPPQRSDADGQLEMLRSTAAAPGAEAVALTEAGTRMAQRMTAVASLDAAGRAVAFSPEAAQFTPAFGGKESFLEGGEAVHYTALQTSAQKARAAQGLAATLYNLGLDEEYLAAAQEPEPLRAALEQALAGNPAFFRPENPLWQAGGWLPEVLERPQMFGTGYALAGGRNVLDVTRQRDPATGARWVRVRFVTPYRTAAYAVTVTPTQRADYALIAPMIRAKHRDRVEIVFRALPAAGGAVATLDKLGFDLAVFGELEPG